MVIHLRKTKTGDISKRFEHPQHQPHSLAFVLLSYLVLVLEHVDAAVVLSTDRLLPLVVLARAVPAVHTTRRLSGDAISNDLANTVERATGVRNAGSRVMRPSTASSLLCTVGLPAMVVAQLGGWASEDSLRKFYVADAPRLADQVLAAQRLAPRPAPAPPRADGARQPATRREPPAPADSLGPLAQPERVDSQIRLPLSELGRGTRQVHYIPDLLAWVQQSSTNFFF